MQHWSMSSIIKNVAPAEISAADPSITNPRLYHYAILADEELKVK